MEYPKLRTDIEIFPAKISDGPTFCVRDPFNLTDKMLFIPPQTLFIISLFNGKNSLLDIQAAFMRKYGTLLPRNKIEELVDSFDACLFMDNEKFEGQKVKNEEEFRKSAVRKPVLAGRGYELEPEKLKKQIGEYFKSITEPIITVNENKRGTLQGIIAPHIDFMRGGPCYAFAYQEVMKSEPADTYLILGTSHAFSKTPFILCRKKFVTPFGEIEVDQDIVDILEKEYGYPLFDDEKNHQNEHSIEFQLVFLQYLLAGKKDIKIVPVLCGSFHNIIAKGEEPFSSLQIMEFIGAVKKAISSSSKKRIFIIAGADLAHIGQQFGDTFQVDRNILNWVEKEDMVMLNTIKSLDLKAFYNSVYHDGDKRKICGFPPIFTMLGVMDSGTGYLLKYEKWADPGGAAAVTFAGMAFYDE
ncbi:MAG: AmmeMemoRadiSam system protein B [Thermodesulfobacteriota bacterium]|nr:AmmeMemoRadiSam system protein B [Thermodesulfobacteriota bacterium]